jgi:dienelactone hydrolase
MRFLWQLRPASPTAQPQTFGPPASGPSRLRLDVVVAGKTVARTTLVRRVTPASVHVRRLTVRSDGVDGFLFSPGAHTRRPAVVAFGGAEGGLDTIDTAGLLATHGYPALALSYFKSPGLPSHLVRIPLEYFARAARLLRRDPAADPARIVTLGYSYGGEASLLVASAFPNLVQGAIALVPSAEVTSGLPELGGAAAAWTLRGKAVPERPIPVERISGPILVQGAASDSVWDSAGAVTQIERRLRAHHFRYAHVGVVYPGAGHFSGTAMPYMPGPTNQSSGGGSRRADAAAQADIWRRVLSLLEDQSGR